MGIDDFLIQLVKYCPSVICKEAPLTIYPGNPQGRHPGETGARGCYFVKVTQGEIAFTEFVETDSIRWHIRDIFIEGLEDEGKLMESLFSQLEEIQYFTNWIRKSSSFIPISKYFSVKCLKS